MSTRVRYQPRRTLSIAICLALLAGSGVFAWLVLGVPIEDWFGALGRAISRAGG